MISFFGLLNISAKLRPASFMGAASKQGETDEKKQENSDCYYADKGQKRPFPAKGHGLGVTVFRWLCLLFHRLIRRMEDEN
jgi:hypothetical protein